MTRWRLRWAARPARAIVAAVWWVLLGLAFVSSGVALRNVVVRIAAPVTPPQALGFVVADKQPYPSVGPVIGAAMRSGLRQGDEIVGVDGRLAASDIVGFARQSTVAEGRAVNLTVRSEGGDVRTVLLTRNEHAFRRELASSGLTPGLVVLGIQGLRFVFGECLFLFTACVLMRLGARDPLAPYASTVMLLFVLGTGGSGQALASQLLGDIRFIAVPHVAAYASYAVLLAIFPTGRFEPRWSVLAAIAGAGAAIGSLFLTNDLADLFVALSQIPGACAIVARLRRMPGGIERQQIRWALLSIGASVAMLMLATLFEMLENRAVGVGTDLWLRIGESVCYALAHALVVLGITVALLRYRLYDADAAITRSVAYSLLTLVIVATFSLSSNLLQFAEGEYLGSRFGPVATALSGVVAAAMIAPFQRWTTNWAEQRFRGNLTHLAATLPPLLDELRLIALPAAVAHAALDKIVDGTRAVRGAILVGDEALAVCRVAASSATQWAKARRLEESATTIVRDREDTVFPTRVPLRTATGCMMGWLLLGARPDGSLLGKDERDLVQTLSGPVASALRVAKELCERAACLQRSATGTERRQILDLRSRLGEADGDYGM